MAKNFTIGLDKFHFAPITAESETSISYSVPTPLLDGQNVQVKPKIISADVSGDNTTETFNDVSGADVTMQKTMLTSAENALLLGERTHTSGVKISGDAPYGAFGYRRKYQSGIQRLIWVLKVKFKDVDENINTGTKDNLNPQFDTITGTSDKRLCDGEWKITKESPISGFTTEEVAAFFSKATLETNYSIATQTYSEPVETVFVDTLPTTGVGGKIYITDDLKYSYWNGTIWVENGSGTV